MPSLQDIPVELREQIIEQVINFQKDPFSVSAERENAPRYVCRIFEHQEDMQEGNIAFTDDPTAYRPNTHGLLLANRQLRSETLSCLRRLKTAYHLSVKWLSLSNDQLCPTWTWIPSAPVRNEPVDLTITLTYDANKVPFVSNESGKSDVKLSLHVLIMRFLRHGPVGPLHPTVEKPDMPSEFHGRMNQDGNHFAIKTLRINCSTRSQEKRGALNLDDTRKFAHKMDRIFMVLFHRDAKSCATNPKHLHGDGSICPDGLDLTFRAIGRIVILGDGRLYKAWDVAECLKYHRYVARSRNLPPQLPIVPGSQEDVEFQRWYMQVCDSRRRQGLDAPYMELGERWSVDEVKEFRKKQNIM